eukprot:CAMPEP_0180306158 /NCGR_PEP_ID=MMETSP0988-20121125/26864_1 /TAXON_ID=697907 /ORGANISM="non described non described, Strain CCMP2293" /LENGTH=118 /DNA_ID=CAMNT_0022288747 /DNA_START=249 /DNA_END=602 /DNA_ORIENTATION=+
MRNDELDSCCGTGIEPRHVAFHRLDLGLFFEHALELFLLAKHLRPLFRLRGVAKNALANALNEPERAFIRLRVHNHRPHPRVCDSPGVDMCQNREKRPVRESGHWLQDVPAHAHLHSE